MNKTNYKQYDTRWATLGYPKKPWYIKNCGCGEVAVCNSIIEMEQYKGQTPKTIQPYCKQYAEPHGNGTYHSGIPAMMKHYGMTEVKEHQTMNPLWAELAKGNRVAIYLMGSRKGGSKKVHWTSSGHFVCSTDYKYENGKHWVYVKDSASASGLRNGWISYEDNMRGDVSKVWSGKLNSKATTTPVSTSYNPTTPYKGTLPNGVVKKGSKGADVKAVQTFLNWCMNAKLAVDGSAGPATVNAIKAFQTKYKLAVDGSFGPACKAKAKTIIAQYAPKTWQQKTLEWADKIANDNTYGYVTQNDSNPNTKKCCICAGFPKDSKYHGWNCIRFVGAALVHGGGLTIKSANHTLVTNATANKMLRGTVANAKSIWESRNGGTWQIIENGKKAIPTSMLKPCDVVICYKGEGKDADYQHMCLYAGDGYIYDDTSSKGVSKRKYSSLGSKPLIAVRYIGK